MQKEETSRTTTTPTLSTEDKRGKDAFRAALTGNPNFELFVLKNSSSSSNEVSMTPVATTKEEDGDEDGSEQRSPPLDEELLQRDFTKDAVTGNLLFWGAYKGHSSVMDTYQKHPRLFSKVLLPVVSQLFMLQKDIPAVSLLVRNGTPSLVISEASGHNALHILCSRKNPNAALIAELLRFYQGEDEIDLPDHKGLGALHLVAKCSVGTDGRTVAKLLLRLGADPEMTCDDGKNVRTLATNPYVRQVIGYESLRYRDIPQADHESRVQIDSYASADQFPQLPPVDTEPPRLDQSIASGGSQDGSTASPHRQKGRPPLQPDDVDALVNRLYTQSVKQREISMAHQLQQLEPVENRRLTAEEQDAVCERLWRSEMEQREENKQELLDRYSPEREKQPLDFETQTESAQRLCNAALEHKKQAHQALESKYWAPDPRLAKKLSKGQQAASAARLHDESQERTRATFSAIATKYLDKDKTRFSGGSSITPEKMKEMADRLSSRK